MTRVLDDEAILAAFAAQQNAASGSGAVPQGTESTIAPPSPGVGGVAAAQGIDGSATAAHSAEAAPHVPEYRYFRPFPDAADEFVAQAKTLHTGQRIYTGIEAFDAAMRGLAPRELMVVQGFAHNGKTLFVQQMILHNAHRRMVLFTPDEDRVLTLVKLTSLVHGISAEVLEERIADGDTETESLIRSVAATHFPNLVVYDDVSDPRTMTKALAEADRWWASRGQPAGCEFAAFDYAKLCQVGDGDGDVATKMNALKAWGKVEAVPLAVMHQSSRTAGKDGAEVTLTSGEYGGEQQATFVVGVRRKKNQWHARIRELREKLVTQANPNVERIEQQISEAEWELERHRDTVTFNLLKNKRPPSRLVDDTDFHLDPDTGRISPVDQAFSRSSAVGGRRPVTAADIAARRSAAWTEPTLPDFEEPF